MRKENFEALVKGYSLVVGMLAMHEKEENLCELEEILHYLIVDEAFSSSAIVQPYVGKPLTVDGRGNPITLTGPDPDKVKVHF